MSDTTDDANNPNNLMSKFQKLQSEANEIQSIFSKQSSFVATSFSGNKMLKEICESMRNQQKEQNKFNEELLKTIKELKYQSEQKFSEELLEAMKDQNTELKNRQNEQDKFNEEHFMTNTELKHQSEQVLKEIRSIKSDLEESKKQHSLEIQSMKKSMSVPDSVDSLLLPDISVKNSRSLVPEDSNKRFIVKHVFENLSSMISNETRYSDLEEHFGITWKISIQKYDKYLSIYLESGVNQNFGQWKVRTDYVLKSNVESEFNTIESRESFGADEEYWWGWTYYGDWDKVLRWNVANPKLKVEAHVAIRSMTGIYKVNKRNFDETMRESSDVVITVAEQKFYVFKLLLSAQSAYFKSLFLEDPEKSSATEVTIDDVDPSDFQIFMELLYGESVIDEVTVENLLFVSRKFDAPTVIRRCEEFLMKTSQKSTKKKLQMADKYDLDRLMKFCIDGVKSIADIRSVIPSDSADMEKSTINALFQKALSIVE